jgi:hypothetical protein
VADRSVRWGIKAPGYIIQRGPDEERKASMARNRMVVSRGDQPPSPVVNVGSRYS